jgi:DnaJ-class molecular chaperone
MQIKDVTSYPPFVDEFYVQIDDLREAITNALGITPTARWVNCEACGGSGEIIRLNPNARDPSDEYAEICAACEGTGRDCAEPK